MISLQKLINSTPQDVKGRSKDVVAVVNAVTLSSKSSGNVKIATIVFNGKGKAAAEENWWDFSIELYPNEIHQNIFSKVSTNNAAWVKCSCPFFHFYCKYAVAKKQSTSIGVGPILYRDADGRDGDKGALAPASAKNPGSIAYLCKHLFRAQAAVVQRAQELAKKETRKGDVKFTG